MLLYDTQVLTISPWLASAAAAPCLTDGILSSRLLRNNGNNSSNHDLKVYNDFYNYYVQS